MKSNNVLRSRVTPRNSELSCMCGIFKMKLKKRKVPFGTITPPPSLGHADVTDASTHKVEQSQAVVDAHDHLE